MCIYSALGRSRSSHTAVLATVFLSACYCSQPTVEAGRPIPPVARKPPKGENPKEGKRGNAKRKRRGDNPPVPTFGAGYAKPKHELRRVRNANWHFEEEVDTTFASDNLKDGYYSTGEDSHLMMGARFSVVSDNCKVSRNGKSIGCSFDGSTTCVGSEWRNVARTMRRVKTTPHVFQLISNSIADVSEISGVGYVHALQSGVLTDPITSVFYNYCTRKGDEYRLFITGPPFKSGILKSVDGVCDMTDSKTRSKVRELNDFPSPTSLEHCCQTRDLSGESTYVFSGYNQVITPTMECMQAGNTSFCSVAALSVDFLICDSEICDKLCDHGDSTKCFHDGISSCIKDEVQFDIESWSGYIGPCTPSDIPGDYYKWADPEGLSPKCFAGLRRVTSGNGTTVSASELYKYDPQHTSSTVVDKLYAGRLTYRCIAPGQLSNDRGSLGLPCAQSITHTSGVIWRCPNAVVGVGMSTSKFSLLADAQLCDPFKTVAGCVMYTSCPAQTVFKFYNNCTQENFVPDPTTCYNSSNSDGVSCVGLKDDSNGVFTPAAFNMNNAIPTPVDMDHFLDLMTKQGNSVSTWHKVLKWVGWSAGAIALALLILCAVMCCCCLCKRRNDPISRKYRVWRGHETYDEQMRDSRMSDTKNRLRVLKEEYETNMQAAGNTEMDQTLRSVYFGKAKEASGAMLDIAKNTKLMPTDMAAIVGSSGVGVLGGMALDQFSDYASYTNRQGKSMFGALKGAKNKAFKAGSDALDLAESGYISTKGKAANVVSQTRARAGQAAQRGGRGMTSMGSAACSLVLLGPLMVFGSLDCKNGSKVEMLADTNAWSLNSTYTCHMDTAIVEPTVIKNCRVNLVQAPVTCPTCTQVCVTAGTGPIVLFPRFAPWVTTKNAANFISGTSFLLLMCLLFLLCTCQRISARGSMWELVAMTLMTTTLKPVRCSAVPYCQEASGCLMNQTEIPAVPVTCSGTPINNGNLSFVGGNNFMWSFETTSVQPIVAGACNAYVYAEPNGSFPKRTPTIVVQTEGVVQNHEYTLITNWYDIAAGVSFSSHCDSDCGCSTGPGNCPPSNWQLPTCVSQSNVDGCISCNRCLTPFLYWPFTNVYGNWYRLNSAEPDNVAIQLSVMGWCLDGSRQGFYIPVSSAGTSTPINLTVCGGEVVLTVPAIGDLKASLSMPAVNILTVPLTSAVGVNGVDYRPCSISPDNYLSAFACYLVDNLNSAACGSGSENSFPCGTTNQGVMQELQVYSSLQNCFPLAWAQNPNIYPTVSADPWCQLLANDPCEPTGLSANDPSVPSTCSFPGLCPLTTITVDDSYFTSALGVTVAGGDCDPDPSNVGVVQPYKFSQFISSTTNNVGEPFFSQGKPINLGSVFTVIGGATGVAAAPITIQMKHQITSVYSITEVEGLVFSCLGNDSATGALLELTTVVLKPTSPQTGILTCVGGGDAIGSMQVAISNNITSPIPLPVSIANHSGLMMNATLTCSDGVKDIDALCKGTNVTYCLCNITSKLAQFYKPDVGNGCGELMSSNGTVLVPRSCPVSSDMPFFGMKGISWPHLGLAFGMGLAGTLLIGVLVAGVVYIVTARRGSRTVTINK